MSRHSKRIFPWRLMSWFFVSLIVLISFSTTAWSKQLNESFANGGPTVLAQNEVLPLNGILKEAVKAIDGLLDEPNAPHQQQQPTPSSQDTREDLGGTGSGSCQLEFALFEALVGMAELLGLATPQLAAQTNVEELIQRLKGLLRQLHRPGSAPGCLPIMLTQALASLYAVQGRYGYAEQLLLALKIYIDQHLSNRLLKVMNLQSLGYVYAYQGRIAEARPLLSEALAIQRNNRGPNGHIALATEASVAALSTLAEDYDGAERLFQQQWQRIENTHMERHVLTCSIQLEWTHLNLLQGQDGARDKYTVARQRAESVIERCTPQLGDLHPHIIRAHHLLALAHKGLAEENIQAAAEQIKRALDKSKQLHQGEHPQSLSIQLDAIPIYALAGDLEQALELLQSLDGDLLAWLEPEIQTTPVGASRSLTASHTSAQAIALTLALEYPANERAQRLAARYILRQKGIQSEAELLLNQLARNSTDTKVKKLAAQVQTLRARLATVYNVKLESAREQQNVLLAELYQQLSAAEINLAQANGQFRRQLEQRRVSVTSLRNAIGRGEALVEFREYPAGGLYRLGSLSSANMHWGAVVVDQASIRTWDLGPVEDVAKLMGPMLAGSGDRGIRRVEGQMLAQRERFLQSAAMLYKKIIEPLDIASYDVLYLAPDGVLNLVPYASLVGVDGAYWIEHDKPALRLVQSGREVVQRRSGTTAKPRQGLLAVGGIDYGEFAKRPAPDSDQKVSGEQTIRHMRKLGPLIDQIVLGGNRLAVNHDMPLLPPPMLGAIKPFAFKSLPHSTKEVKAIGALYQRSRPQEPTHLLVAGAATEARLKNIQTPPRILHLATHGFFRETGEATTRPMLLSGIVLSQANLKPTGAGDDGVLYALEVQNLMLDGTELVVLSACETAQGVVGYGEGVFGMVRALRSAGARNILVTLRPIRDEDASEFMLVFYQNYLARPDSTPAAALAATQHYFVVRERQQQEVPDWSPYVLFGL